MASKLRETAGFDWDAAYFAFFAVLSLIGAAFAPDSLAMLCIVPLLSYGIVSVIFAILAYVVETVAEIVGIIWTDENTGIKLNEARFSTIATMIAAAIAYVVAMAAMGNAADAAYGAVMYPPFMLLATWQILSESKVLSSFPFFAPEGAGRKKGFANEVGDWHASTRKILLNGRTAALCIFTVLATFLFFGTILLSPFIEHNRVVLLCFAASYATWVAMKKAKKPSWLFNAEGQA